MACIYSCESQTVFSSAECFILTQRGHCVTQRIMICSEERGSESDPKHSDGHLTANGSHLKTSPVGYLSFIAVGLPRKATPRKASIPCKFDLTDSMSTIVELTRFPAGHDSDLTRRPTCFILSQTNEGVSCYCTVT